MVFSPAWAKAEGCAVVSGCFSGVEGLVFFDVFPEPAELPIANFFEPEVVDVGWEEEFGDTGIKKSFNFVLVVGNTPLIDIVEI